MGYTDQAKTKKLLEYISQCSLWLLNHQFFQKLSISISLITEMLILIWTTPVLTNPTDWPIPTEIHCFEFKKNFFAEFFTILFVLIFTAASPKILCDFSTFSHNFTSPSETELGHCHQKLNVWAASGGAERFKTC